MLSGKRLVAARFGVTTALRRWKAASYVAQTNRMKPRATKKSVSLASSSSGRNFYHLISCNSHVLSHSSIRLLPLLLIVLVVDLFDNSFEHFTRNTHLSRQLLLTNVGRKVPACCRDLKIAVTNVSWNLSVGYALAYSNFHCGLSSILTPASSVITSTSSARLAGVCRGQSGGSLFESTFSAPMAILHRRSWPKSMRVRTNSGSRTNKFIESGHDFSKGS